MYPDHNNWSPRVGLAYSPTADSGLARFFFGGPGKTAIRAGAGMYYDEMGQPLAQTINANAFGLATTLTDSAQRPEQFAGAAVHHVLQRAVRPLCRPRGHPGWARRTPLPAPGRSPSPAAWTTS